MNATTKLVKLALRRDNSYPVGVSAPLHCVCRCGGVIKLDPAPVQAVTYKCPGCDVVIDSAGWIVSGSPRNLALEIASGHNNQTR